MENAEKKEAAAEDSSLIFGIANMTKDLGQMLRRTASETTRTITSPTAVSRFSSYLDRATSTVLSSESPNEIDAENERNALYGAFKASLNGLIDNYAGSGIPLEDDNMLLERFCIILEHVLMHGIRSRRGWRRSSAWDFVSTLDNMATTTVRDRYLFDNIRNMEGLKTPRGRLRAWIRLSLMDQSLSEKWKILTEQNRATLEDFYESWALLRSEKLTPISGLMLALNSIEFNLCLKGDDLEPKTSTIDWGYFMDSGRKSPMVASTEESPQPEGSEISTLLQSATQQKSYVEELNRTLVQRMESLSLELEKVKKELAESKESFMAKENAFEAMTKENNGLKVKINELNASLEIEKKNFIEKMEIERKYFRDLKADSENLRETKVQLQEKVAKLSREKDEALEEKNRTLEILKATQSHLVSSIKAKEELKEEIGKLKGETLDNDQE